MKTMLSIVNELIRKGHHVQFYIRKDGGILIRKIDNEHFTGAHGNARARELVGASLSEARTAQLKYATKTRQIQRKLPKIEDAVEKEYNRVKKIWNKAFKAKEGKPNPAGYFGKGRIRYAQKTYGTEEALRRIHEAERYATGVAYSKNVRILSMFITNAGYQFESQELIDLGQLVLENSYSIKEEYISPAYSELYKLNQGLDPKEVARNVKRILRL